MATVPNEPNSAVDNTTQLGQASQLSLLSNQKKLGLIIAAAAIIALLAGAWMWSQTPDYRVLYSNVSNQDGGAIITALQQMNIPYKFTEGGGSILIPGDQVYEARLRLAGQGIPKSGLAGFELMENQKFGSSQFLEQINYQRALEGELARSVQSISSVQSARVHIAISKPSVFARKKQKPSVSVLLNLHPGRILSEEQVNAVVNLVSGSIPNLSAKNVTVVDQNGNLLSTKNENKPDARFDAKQLQYIQELEGNYIKRIEKILIPITGKANVRAQVTADIDFSRIERAEEIYKPNNKESETASIRSQQSVESSSSGPLANIGIPGALTNQPPEPAQAPIEIDNEDGTTPNNAAKTTPTNQRTESTTNYEVDKTIQHTHQSTGNIKRLSAAVVINYRKKIEKISSKTEENSAEKTDEENSEEAVEEADEEAIEEKEIITYEPLADEEIERITSLVKEAMGYNESRGDTLTVMNNLFTVDEVEPIVETPLWKDPDNILLAKEIGKQLLIATIVLFFLLKIIRPFFKNLTELQTSVASLPDNNQSENNAPALDQSEEHAKIATEADNKPVSKLEHEQNLQAAKQLAVDEPAIVANVVKGWVSSNG